MKKLNDKYNYGCELILLSVDEGITGYRDDSLEVRNSLFSKLFNAPLLGFIHCAVMEDKLLPKRSPDKNQKLVMIIGIDHV